MPDRHRPAAVGIVGLVATLALTVCGGLISLLPTSGLHCPAPSAVVMLDPGHGGDDPGASNETVGLDEREVVLDIARRTRAFLHDTGYSAALTRQDDATGYANTPRGQIANLCHAFAYVSIHLNSFDQPDPDYAKTFWGSEAKDTAFAAVLQMALVDRLQPGTDLGDSGLEQLENGGLLTALMPAALVEPVFLSNPDEAARLADPRGARRDDIAHAIADGVDVWLGSHQIGPARVDPIGSVAMTAQDSLLAPARGSAVQALGVAFARGVSRPEALWAYVMEVYRLAPLVGLDPAIVVAQSALETGWWRSLAWTDHLNPAGIGVTGAEVTSLSWQSGADAAHAQLVHLYLYAAGTVPPGNPLEPYLAADPRYEIARDAGRGGTAHTIADLSGTWATDPHYAASIARVGSELFALP
jgi:N-acetylmuramoyl-L-alanine amidase